MRGILSLLLVTLMGAPGTSWAVEPGQPEQKISVGGELRVGVLQGPPRELVSDAGFGFGMSSQWFYRPKLGLRVDATFDRFGGFLDTHKQLSHFGFSVLPVVGAHAIGPWLGWAGIGGGLTVAWFRSNDEEVARPGTCELDPDLPAGTCPATKRAAVPFARALIGVGRSVSKRLAIMIAAEYALRFSEITVEFETGSSTRDIRVFDDSFVMGIEAHYFF